MQSLSWLLAWRYLLGTAYEKSISTMAAICFSGILIGTFSLALVLFVMNGFEKVTHEKLRSIHPSITMRSYGNTLDTQRIGAVLKEDFPAVTAWSPTHDEHVIIQGQSDQGMNVALLRAIEPHSQTRVSALEKKIIHALNAPTLASTLADNHVLIGHKLAQELEVAVGMPINLMFSEHGQPQSRKVRFKEKTTLVGGIFDTGIEEFDSNLIIGSFALMNTMWPDSGATQLSISLDPNTDQETTLDALRVRFGLEAYSWQDLYPALVSALKLEKYVMFFILALITLVASMNIISLLFMKITHKRGDIAILKAMGMRDRAIQHIFLIMGSALCFFGALAGLALAGIVGTLLQNYPFITLPDVYYVSHLPVHMTWHLFAAVFIVVMILGMLATWLPTRTTRSINVSRVLRFEA